ncbi:MULTISPECIES: YgaP family membrane protein [Bacillaceae]|uniref:YgaP family membrane protein n=1 Tax=Bacillaceae TaxID=186817 RepID=UPI002FFDED80
MKISPNIGIVNALIRITAGLAILSWCTAKMVKHPWRDSYFFVAICAAMKVAEGIVRYCPMTAMFEKYQENMACSTPQNDSMDGMEGLTNLDGDEIVPYNPT